MNSYTFQKSLRLGINFILFLTSFLTMRAATHYEVKPKIGDGMYTLFKKYRITPNSVNINYFKEINKLKSIEKLLTGKVYQLPILILPYNGKSIATSIPRINKEAATKVMNYNKLMYTARLRKKTYQQSRTLWVQYHEWNGLAIKNGAQKTNAAKLTTAVVKSVKAPVETRESERALKTPKMKPLNAMPNANKSIDLEAGLIAKLEAEAALKESNLIKESNLNNNAVLRTRTIPIFGSDFEEIRIQNDVLKNKVYYLVSGHGGPDPGTMFGKDADALCEDEYAYDVTLRLARKLMEHGANVHLIVQDPNDGIRNEMYLKIDKDERCITGYPLVLNQRLRLTQTTDAVNDLYRVYRNKGVADKDQLAIHIHIDSRDKEMRKDVFFYYQSDNKNSIAIAKRLQNTLDQKYEEQSGRDYTGTISARNLFVMRNTQAATVYMELGNLQNEADQKRLLYSSNRQALAEWLYDGVVGE